MSGRVVFPHLQCPITEAPRQRSTHHARQHRQPFNTCRLARRSSKATRCLRESGDKFLENCFFFSVFFCRRKKKQKKNESTNHAATQLINCYACLINALTSNPGPERASCRKIDADGDFCPRVVHRRQKHILTMKSPPATSFWQHARFRPSLVAIVAIRRPTSADV